MPAGIVFKLSSWLESKGVIKYITSSLIGIEIIVKGVSEEIVRSASLQYLMSNKYKMG